MSKKNNPISIIEESFLSLKKYLETNINPNEAVFTASFVTNLHKETLSILEICTVLNQDATFIQKINQEVNPLRSKGLLFKVEHFFLSDMIALYDQESIKKSEKAQFVLAYYYDVLRNNHFANENSINELNQLVFTEDFKKHLLKIKKENTIITSNSNQQKSKYLLPEALAEQNHDKLKEVLVKYQNFLHFAFDKKFENTTDFNVFLGLNSNKPKSKNKEVDNFPEEDTLEKVLEELNQLVGLAAVKKDVGELINLLEIQKKRSKQGLKNVEITLHTVFLGPPGTGKTSVARLLSRIFKHLDFLSKGQMYETDREGLVAGYVGQTATKVDAAVESSLGGVLFIDEAYALTQNAFGNDYGAEAVNTLLKRMEDHRDDLAVVVAGYTEPMKIFVESNPGLRSRFNRFFYFDHFSPDELFQIFESFCIKSDFIVSEDAKEKLKDTFELLYAKKDESFGNARVVRNLFEKCIQNQANRIVKLKKISNKTLKTLTEEDIPEPKETEKSIGFGTKEENL
ncbi:AAA family ATPase [Flavobacterium sp. Fl-77]|uniref:AAA family ATPase n=1 Tax=Flavobacterium flavipigmentatum TaxID=2893884 RepID=A0AAJ2W021_9FLAO|nr:MULTISPECIES: AAA family ATPase [unclassified Flavobacterium]MDX6181014.1 AAA family ATPase [Flavobacterium sp. Fl-33]MDX6184615.1 AAA family ATPase [Flavobacterium sp. Fl-77]UFH39717.1 AAA family ATPase [Flavobacterium sp. F-70]